MNTAALYLWEKHSLSSLLADCFHLDPFGISKDYPDNQMKNVCNHFPYLIGFPHLSPSLGAHGIVPISDWKAEGFLEEK